ncbi:TonB-dependent siderophore receptor [Siphonobacter curvatus]|uniref:TonB-dependent siderophore receptor n=2 Tax=Siphonobacter curvatus TaxID=2094562 RepID=A0A2S7ISJ8_9BACT|nr:TonB-dependent siderophore receptor [Siphonobacter curvatus]
MVRGQLHLKHSIVFLLVVIRKKPSFCEGFFYEEPSSLRFYLPYSIPFFSMKKNYLLFLILLGACTSLWAQTGRIQGTITSSDGKPTSQVTISLKGRSAGATSNESGQYAIEKVKAGTYTLRVSFVGLKSQERELEVRENETTQADFTLVETAEQLEEVLVKGTNKFGNKESEYVARLPIKNLENPQVYNVLSKELATEQIAVDYKNLLQNVPGAGVGFGGVNNGVTYLILRGFWVTSQMRNGMASQQSAGIDPINVERVEVLKGPSGTLFGSSLISFGGFSNLVTKKPYADFGGDISYTGGSWSLNRLTADINTPLNKEKTALFRLNLASHNEKSFQTYGFNRNYTVAPSLFFKVNDRLSLQIDAEFFRTNRTTLPAYAFGKAGFKNIKDTPLGYDQAINSNDPLLKMGTHNVFAKAEYKLSDQWTSATQYAYGNIQYDNVNYMYPATWTSDSTIARSISAARNSYTRSMQFQQNFTGDFQIGRFKNRMVVGVDAYYTASLTQSYGVITYDVINIRKPIVPISLSRLENMVANANLTNTFAEQYRYSAYVSDVLNLTDRLMAMLSVRVEKFDNKGTSVNGQPAAAAGVYSQTAVSPKFGLVYQPIKEQLSVFANYMNGFQNVAPITQPDNSILTPLPQYGNQWEVGVKTEALAQKLTATVSYYEIDLKNAIRTDPTRPGFSIQDGQQKSKGVEVDLVANPLPGLNLIVGYGHNEYKYTRANASQEGLSNGLPADIANFWASYKFTQGAAKGWGIGIGGNHVSTIYPNNVGGGITIPAYTKFDATVYYDQPKWRLGIKCNNLTDKRYWGLNYDPQNPRQLLVSLSYKL